jgi:hypothetical protein
MAMTYNGDGRERAGVRCERETVYVEEESGAPVYTRHSGVDWVACEGDGRARTGVRCEHEMVYVEEESETPVYTRHIGVDGGDVRRVMVGSKLAYAVSMTRCTWKEQRCADVHATHRVNRR